MNDYFWLNAELCDDPAIRALSRHDRGNWIQFLSLANKQPVRGVLPGREAIAQALNVPTAKVGRIVSTLIDAGLIDIAPDGALVMNQTHVRFQEENPEPEGAES